MHILHLCVLERSSVLGKSVFHEDFSFESDIISTGQWFPKEAQSLRLRGTGAIQPGKSRNRS
jgi:hypothetical protein